MCLARRLVLVPALALGAHTTSAGTFVIDDQGGAGVDFQDIQPAIDAASHGDLLLVHPGSYAGFTLAKGLTVLGTDPGDRPRVTGPVVVTGLGPNRRATLSSLRTGDLSILQALGHVSLDLLEIAPSAADQEALAVLDCVDVRAYQCTVQCPTDSGQTAAWIEHSRVEFVECALLAADGADAQSGEPGGHGLRLDDESFAVVVSTDCRGGDGGQAAFGGNCPGFGSFYGGDGGAGVLLGGTPFNRLVVAGPPTTTLSRGIGGWGCPDVSEDGASGSPIWSIGTQNRARASGVTLDGPTFGGALWMTLPSPADPYLQRFGTLQAGRQQTFWVYGTPGDTAVLHLGRSPLVSVDPTQEMDDLISHERSVTLGPLPASGRLSYTFTIPGWLPRGFRFFAQAETTTPGGQRLSTNSLPLVLRQ
ncbi:MAG: hypothetical protein H6828_04190 [Planctomycetes bacterium]|nr:hypothetical protein [Planctomycetota bacterium]